MTPQRDLFGELDYRSAKGARVRLYLKFLAMKTMPDNSRNAYLYLFQDGESNRFNWFSNALKALEVGRWYQVSAIVGRPKRFRGVVQTPLKDCRIAKAS